MDNFDFDYSIVSKRNRRKKLEQKTHETIVGPPPTTGVHDLTRQESERLSKKRFNEFLKKK